MEDSGKFKKFECLILSAEAKNCFKCLSAECGYCYMKQNDTGYCLDTKSNSSFFSPYFTREDVGKCSEADEEWYPDFCPTTTAISWTIIVSLAAYLISFAAGTVGLQKTQ